MTQGANDAAVDLGLDHQPGAGGRNDEVAAVLMNLARAGRLHTRQPGQRIYEQGLTVQNLGGSHQVAKLTLVVGHLVLHSILLTDGTITGFLEAGQQADA